MFKVFLLSFLLCLISFPLQARIDIVPQKIVIENRERNGEFTVLNLMNVAGTFRIEMVSFSQNEQGVYTELAEPLSPNFDPQEIVRLSPRQFRIEPGGRQKVRLSLRKPSSLPEGEYRFHVKATRLAQEDERRSEDTNNVSVMANIGVTIPVIVRHGALSSNANIVNTQNIPASQTKNGRPALDVTINREGPASTIGILEVFLLQGNGQAKRIGQIKNMNIFTDINQRTIRVPLENLPSGGAQIKIRYADSVNKGNIFDEKIINL